MIGLSTTSGGARLAAVLLGLLLALGFPSLTRAHLASGEYFIDADPGVGSATSLAAADGSFDTLAESIQTTIAVAALSPGAHRIGLRFQDTNGLWGNAVFIDVQVEDSSGLSIDPPLLSGSPTLRTIVAAEYALDGGAGVALGPKDGAFDTVAEETLSELISAASLSTGTHRVALRLQDSESRWGNDVFVDVVVAESTSLVIDPPLLSGSPTLRTITAAEYALDGGAGVALGPKDGAFDTVAEETAIASIDAASLYTGSHRLALRFQDTDGRFGNAVFVDVMVQDVSTLVVDPPLSAFCHHQETIHTLAAAEYFIEVDPGAGNGTPVAAADGAFDSVAEALADVNLDPLTLPTGPRRFGLRFRDSDGRWGATVYAWVDVFNLSTEAPSIFADPVDLTIFRTEDALFETGAAGSPDLNYQWFFNDAPLSGRTNFWLAILNAQLGNGGDYKLVVSNAYGSATSLVATLTVLSAPFNIASPLSQALPAGSPASFTVSAEGTPSLNYQWFFNGAPLPGANSPILDIASVSSVDVGSYSVRVTNLYGGSQSLEATLAVAISGNVLDLPQVTSQSESRILFAEPGVDAGMVIEVGGPGPATLQWLKNGVPISGATNARLPLLTGLLSNAGYYSVVASNLTGAVSSRAITLTLVDFTHVGGVSYFHTAGPDGSWYRLEYRDLPSPDKPWTLLESFGVGSSPELVSDPSCSDLAGRIYRILKLP